MYANGIVDMVSTVNLGLDSVLVRGTDNDFRCKHFCSRPIATSQPTTVDNAVCEMPHLSLVGTQCSPVSIRKQVHSRKMVLNTQARAGPAALSPKVRTHRLRDSTSNRQKLTTSGSKSGTGSVAHEERISSAGKKEPYSHKDDSSKLSRLRAEKSGRKGKNLPLRSGSLREDGSRDMRIDISATMYSIIGRVATQLGWQEGSAADDNTMMVWRDDCT